ncbi:MAG TPA: hypothetical protein VFC86_09095 [Planctomycetota bacterium]|nr:hypothetical protein [Planctomycetota bacterium]
MAAINLRGSAGLAAAPFYFDRDPFSQGSFAYLWYGILVPFSLFWIWIFIVNPREWAVVKDGRLIWKLGHVFPRSGSVAVADVKCVLVKTIVTPPNNVGVGNAIEHYVVLKDETRLKVPEAAVEHEVLHSMRALNPYIEKRSETVPLRSRDPAARA